MHFPVFPIASALQMHQPGMSGCFLFRVRVIPTWPQPNESFPQRYGGKNRFERFKRPLPRGRRRDTADVAFFILRADSLDSRGPKLDYVGFKPNNVSDVAQKNPRTLDGVPPHPSHGDLLKHPPRPVQPYATCALSRTISLWISGPPCCSSCVTWQYTPLKYRKKKRGGHPVCVFMRGGGRKAARCTI